MDRSNPSDNSIHDTVRVKLDMASGDPGVYVMKDVSGRVLYVGKARNLKKRLASYRKPEAALDIKTRVLMRKVADVETVVTRSEKEALILESNFIKRYRPRYNVNLKDDKRYPSLRLDTRQDYPKLTIVRKIQRDGAMYFGPFASAHAVRETLRFIDKTFKLRKCKRSEFRTRTRPCLHCQMQRCLAPCCMDVHKGDYADIVREVILFLNGRTPELIEKVRRDMEAAVAAREYEQAAALRDKMFALQKTLENQIAVNTDFKDRDVFGLAREENLALITLLTVRGGFLMGTRHFEFPDPMSTDGEVFSTFLRQYYEKAPDIPEEILLPMAMSDQALIVDWLIQLKGRRVRVLLPKRGEKAELLKMAVRNAAKAVTERSEALASELAVRDRLKQRLRLTRRPDRVECIDISNLQGSEPVASMVVFENGAPQKQSYRRYRVRTINGPDDYGAIAEILRRRFRQNASQRPYPDLLMIDGGKGQLNMALAVLEEFGLSKRLDVIGIAKPDAAKGESVDKIFTPGRADPVLLGGERNLLLFLQRIRDEAHRVAITYHRKRRGKRSMASVLDRIQGIGKKRKEALLAHFGSIKKIRAATLEDLRGVPGMNRSAAEAVQRYFKNKAE